MRKHPFLLAFVLLVFAAAALPAQQTLTPLEIKGRKIFHEGARVKSPKALEQIIHQAKDAEAEQLLREYKNMRTIGTVVMIGGLGLETVALMKQLNSNGDGGSATGLLLGGAGLLLTGAIIQAVGWSGKGKAAVQRYNTVVGGGHPLSFRMQAAPQGLGIGLAMTF
ncbi:MAG: hypothetical protein IPH12_02695 [Saprospirales bacterium]|jgi:hypothetical protein|nr:hypothetical protein [Saprospirales bacterium]MBK8921453.1 hypothetical protein [Saprospirales bacterium]